MPVRWSADRYDQLERAIRDGRRVVLMRRGTEYVVLALRLATEQGREVLVGRLPMTGEDLHFVLGDIDHLEVL